MKSLRVPHQFLPTNILIFILVLEIFCYTTNYVENLFNLKSIDFLISNFCPGCRCCWDTGTG